MDRLERDQWTLLESIGQRWIRLTSKDDIFKVIVRLDNADNFCVSRIDFSSVQRTLIVSIRDH